MWEKLYAWQFFGIQYWDHLFVCNSAYVENVYNSVSDAVLNLHVTVYSHMGILPTQHWCSG